MGPLEATLAWDASSLGAALLWATSQTGTVLLGLQRGMLSESRVLSVRCLERLFSGIHSIDGHLMLSFGL